MTLTKVGFYKEMPHAENTDPSILDCIHKADYSDETAQICSYLKNGTIYIACCGVCYDVIDQEKGVAGVPSLLTDGVWIWPGDLAYYVENYNLNLPANFIDHMKANRWSNSLTSDMLNDEDIVIQ